MATATETRRAWRKVEQRRSERLARQRDSAIGVRRRIGARKAVATKIVRGEDPAAALKRHRARKAAK